VLSLFDPASTKPASIPHKPIRVLELVAELGFDGGKTLVYEYVAELRPLLRRGRASCAAADASAHAWWLIARRVIGIRRRQG
jgi:hypothetical protein